MPTHALHYVCADCGRDLPATPEVWRCPSCEGLLDLPDDVELPAAWFAAVDLGSTPTPLVEVDGVHVKVEYLHPTGSFKDRGARVLVAAAKGLHARSIALDSSGNAGLAVAAHAARAGLRTTVVLPARTSPGKAAAIRSLGARVVVVNGPREQAAAVVRDEMARSGAMYASHVYNPLFAEGVASYVDELVDQLGGLPETLVLPVGNGTFVLGAARAIARLRRRGHVRGRGPRLVGVQAQACAPIARAFDLGADRVKPVAAAGTPAEGIAIAAPPRGTQVLRAVRESGGRMLSVSDLQIRAAQRELAARGWLVEPTAAAAWAARTQLTADDGAVVLPLPGTGLKTGLAT